uniref:Uncharacterized protein n=1 Tax=Thorea hispida TaxID=202687 RepID=A0A1C9CAC9_9FLOR|nr:hypothetical protein Thor_051 [Thorea hispida]AOM65343.1 hypothetical protein Thor_051 [Thorea hispida]
MFFLYIVLSTLVFLTFFGYLYIGLLIEFFQTLFYYLFILVFITLSINNSRYLETPTQLLHFWIIINYNCCKNFIEFFLYLLTLKTFTKYSEKIILYCSLYSSKVICRAYLIVFSYLIFNQLLFISATNEDILCSYVPYILFYRLTKYYINIILITIILSFNHINIVKYQINNKFTSLYLKKMKITHNNVLFIISKIFILILQDIIQYCNTDACVIHYRKAFPPYRRIWLYY